jgi:hypothetical protein
MLFELKQILSDKNVAVILWQYLTINIHLSKI